MEICSILLQNSVIEGAAHATQDPLINWIFVALTSTILALSVVIGVLYKSKNEQDKEHKREMKELYSNLNITTQEAIKSITITNERLK